MDVGCIVSGRPFLHAVLSYLSMSFCSFFIRCNKHFPVSAATVETLPFVYIEKNLKVDTSPVQILL